MTLGVQSLSILLPILILLLSPATSPASASHQLALSHLIALASAHPVAFRQAAAALEDVQRQLLEVSVRASVAGGSGANGKREAIKEIPKIELKSFG